MNRGETKKKKTTIKANRETGSYWRWNEKSILEFWYFHHWQDLKNKTSNNAIFKNEFTFVAIPFNKLSFIQSFIFHSNLDQEIPTLLLNRWNQFLRYDSRKISYPKCGCPFETDIVTNKQDEKFRDSVHLRELHVSIIIPPCFFILSSYFLELFTVVVILLYDLFHFCLQFAFHHLNVNWSSHRNDVLMARIVLPFCVLRWFLFYPGYMLDAQMFITPKCFLSSANTIATPRQLWPLGQTPNRMHKFSILPVNQRQSANKIIQVSGRADLWAGV